MPKRYTPEIINEKTLKPEEVFVFGSNEAGIHGAGAAKFALDKLGAVWGNGFGRQGRTFAIPTKDWHIQTLDLQDIHFYVSRFLDYAATHKDQKFLVTKIGCGLAGFYVEDIAPLFIAVFLNKMDNVILPKEFWTEILAINTSILP